jgi:magnesium-transporting ATPase (P-type)
MTASLATGLTDAEVAQRVAEGKTNDVPARAARSVSDIVRANVFTRINAILGVLLIIVLTTGSVINGLFGLLIVANSAIGIVQELRAKQTLDKLAIVGQAKRMVRREGGIRELLPGEVVLDDIIELGPGDQIVVDGEVVDETNLEVDESLLTGEADPIAKDAGDQVMSGSFVVAGSGAYRATKVGRAAYAAKLAEEASKFTLVKSELRTGINKILQLITYLLIPAGLLIIYTQLFTTHAGWRQSVLRMVGALVPMVPEGLVLMTSIAFAVGVVRRGRRQCLVQELPAIEGLARVDMVCADKTGTLTENGMRVAGIEQEGDRGIHVGGQERSDKGIHVGGQERSDGGIHVGGQERSDKGIHVGGQERSDKGIHVGGQERSDGGIHVGGQERSDKGINNVADVLASLAAGDTRPNASIRAVAEAFDRPPGWTPTLRSPRRPSGLAPGDFGCCFSAPVTCRSTIPTPRAASRRPGSSSSNSGFAPTPATH